MLHIVNKSPLERGSLDACLGTAQAGGALLLIEDGIYAATRGNAASAKLAQAFGRLTVYVLGPDAAARGMSNALIEGVRTVDYGGFVDLVVEHSTCQSWL